MRTNIDIDDALMAKAMKAGPYKTKKDAVEAGLKLLARQAAYREILKWEGKLKWEGDESIDWTALPTEPEAEKRLKQGAQVAAEPLASYRANAASSGSTPRKSGSGRARR